MEAGASIAESVDACRKFAEIFSSPGDGFVVELECNAPSGFLVDGNVELEARVNSHEVQDNGSNVQRH